MYSQSARVTSPPHCSFPAGFALCKRTHRTCVLGQKSLNDQNNVVSIMNHVQPIFICSSCLKFLRHQFDPRRVKQEEVSIENPFMHAIY